MPAPKETYIQLCLNLGDADVVTHSRAPRALPSVVATLFELSDTSPSGIVWKTIPPGCRKKVGDTAGSPTRGGKYFLVYISEHGYFYAHRIAYYLQHGDNPGNMVVRHLDDNELVVGYQRDNMQDQEGKTYGSYTKRKFEYKGDTYNLSSLCRRLGLDYHNFNYVMRKHSNIHITLAHFGLFDVTPLF